MQEFLFVETLESFKKNNHMRFITFSIACLMSLFSFAQSNSKLAEKTKNMQKFEGYFNFCGMHHPEKYGCRSTNLTPNFCM